MRRTRVKVCCISSVEEASIAIDAGADALGLVSAMPSGPGVISMGTIAQIADRVPPAVATFLLTSERHPERIIEQHHICKTTTLQLVDHVEVDTYKVLRKALPGIKLVQVIHVIDEESLADAVKLDRVVDALLLDSGNPNLEVKELGGTGRAHNWQISRQIVKSVSIPVFLAGGLRYNNVGSAIDLVQPFGIDFCSGVRTDGALDRQKLKQLMSAITV